MRKAIFLSLFALSFVLLLAGQAAAVVCTNANKMEDAGNVGDVIVRLDGSITLPTNNGGQLAGGFVDVFVEFDIDGDGVADGMVQVANDVYILDVSHTLAAGLPFPELPHGAHLAAGCGVGVDDILVCGP